LIKDVYEALRAGAAWNETLFIVTYDEHGGFYDHVSPPSSVPPPDDIPSFPDSFDFTRGGVRIPTLLVSPWIKKGTVISDPTPAQKPANNSVFELTSIPATMKKMFELDGDLSNRSAWAATFESYLEDLTEPRTDCVTKLPDVPDALTEEAASWEANRPLNDLQADYVRLVSHIQGESARHITHQRHGGAFVRKHTNVILQGGGLHGLHNCDVCKAKGNNCWFPKFRPPQNCGRYATREACEEASYAAVWCGE